MSRPKQVTDEELLSVALDCFLEYGPNVSTQVIADRVGLSQPALFKRFGTKEELFLQALAPPERLPVIDWIDASPSPGPIQPQLVQLLQEVWEVLVWVLPQVQLLQAARIPRKTVMSRYETPPPVMLSRSITGFFVRAQQQGQVRPDVDPQHVAQWVFGALMGRRFSIETMPSEAGADDAAAFIESTANILCSGIVNGEKIAPTPGRQ